MARVRKPTAAEAEVKQAEATQETPAVETQEAEQSAEPAEKPAPKAKPTAKTKAAQEADKLAAMQKQLDEANARAAAAEEAARMAINNPASIRKDEHTDYHDTPDLGAVHIGHDGNGDIVKTYDEKGDGFSADLETFARIDKDYVEKMRFLNEPVTIIIPASGEPDGHLPVMLSVNGEGALGGKNKYIPRDREVTIKRFFVEALLRDKRVDFTYKQEDVGGIQMANHYQKVRLKYPFTVVEDKNPLGSAWHKKIVAEM